MTQDLERGLTNEHQVSYVALWPGLPLLAVHALENRAKRSVLRALHAVLGGAPAAKLAVPPGGLGATLRACFPHLSLQVGESALNIPKVARLQSLPHEPIPLGEEEKKRLETWNEALAQLGPRLRPVDDGYTLTDGRGTWVHFEGPNLLEKLRKLYMSGNRAIISKDMKPAFLGKRYHVVQRDNK
ncbi:hypothetical protein V5799_025796 [Amblyomma americanum]|uniref:Uncharacterized protein n=1 Tax=Amblyomma americanum TaxID=6943 RepID=A0AAQ4E8G9_AMBAM